MSTLDTIATRLFKNESIEAVAADFGCEPTALAAWKERSLATLDELTGADAGDGDGGSTEPTPRRVHHVGIVARNEEQIERFTTTLGLVEVRREHLPKYHVTNVFFSAGGGAQIQFMLPEGGILANFNGGEGGLHHLAFSTPDVDVLQRELEARGLRFIARGKQQGIGRFQFNFVLPNVEGVNVELIEDPEAVW